MTKKQRKALTRILISAALLIAAAVTEHLAGLPDWAELLLYAVPYLVIGLPVLKKAAVNISHGQVFDENFLMSVATLGAFAAREGEEAVAVMLFYQVGELFENYAVGKSRGSIAQLMDIRPDIAAVEREGVIEEVDPEEVAVGETIVIQPGDRVPLDGTVLEGSSMLDTAALTGESVPRAVRPGDGVISGCINQSGVLRVRVEKEFGESTVARILELVENSSDNKAKAENFITRFARYYTPIVCFAALALAILPPAACLLVLKTDPRWMMWIRRALMFLVVSCPCALVISVPLSYFGGIGGASSNGILVKGANYLEALSKVDTVVFDKTGTLTEGSFRVTAIHPESMDEQTLLELTALTECYSTHPIARSILDAYARDPKHDRVREVSEISGRGVTATVDGRRVAAGNALLMQELGCTAKPCEHAGTIVHVAVEGVYEGHIVISDTVKKTSATAISELKRLGVRRTVMLTGDSEQVGRHVANELKLDEAYCGLLPADKVSHVERLIGEANGRGALAFVGDGINDAPVLTRADIGIAMGALGSDAAIEAADVVLMNDDPEAIATAIAISRKTQGIVHANIVFALAVKAIILMLAALGLTNMWVAVFGDVGVSVIAILNAMRALKYRKKS